ncbi:hypothetical protein ACFRAR_35375 [Kitasatospora sp. NPDC056651]|uniref:hypothetical protein n=1 Tax=Kitasatospora sp. NPDC056651 TaxID=3345892 RepID=UPI0036ADE41B
MALSRTLPPATIPFRDRPRSHRRDTLRLAPAVRDHLLPLPLPLPLLRERGDLA